MTAREKRKNECVSLENKTILVTGECEIIGTTKKTYDN